MEADIAREYGLDLRHLLWGPERIGARRLQALINGLPLDGALARAYDPDRLGHGWGVQQELTALLAELIDQGNRLFVMAHSKPGAQAPKPLYIARPDDAKRGQARKTDPTALKRFMAQRGIPVVQAPKDKDTTSE